MDNWLIDWFTELLVGWVDELPGGWTTEGVSGCVCNWVTGQRFHLQKVPFVRRVWENFTTIDYFLKCSRLTVDSSFNRKLEYTCIEPGRESSMQWDGFINKSFERDTNGFDDSRTFQWLSRLFEPFSFCIAAENISRKSWMRDNKSALVHINKMNHTSVMCPYVVLLCENSSTTKYGLLRPNRARCTYIWILCIEQMWSSM